MQRLTLLIVLLGISFIGGKAQQQPAHPNDDVESFALELITSPAERRDQLLTARASLINVDLRKQLVRHGNANFAGGRYATAFDIYQLVQKLSDQIDDKEGVATASLNIGSVYYFQGKYDLALDQYRKAENLFASLGNRLDAARSRFGLGLTYQAQQKPTEALQAFDQALKQFEALNDANELVTTLASIGGLQYELGNYEAAAKAFLRVSELSHNGENLVRIADAFYRQHEHAQALVYYQRALETFQSEAKTAGILSATSGIANSYYYQRNYDDALVYHLRGLALEEQLNDKSGIATRLQNLGNVYRAQGDYASALEFYSKSLAVAAEASTKATVANTLGNIGLVRALQGDNAQAIEYFDKSLKEFEASGDQVGMARMLSLIGNARYIQGMYDLALEAYEKSRALHEARADSLNQAHVLVGIGTVYVNRKEYGPALQSYERALHLYEKLGRNTDIAETLARTANAYRLQGDTTRSFEAAEKAVRLARSSDAPAILSYALTEVGQAHRSLKRPAESLNAFDEAINIQRALRAEVSPDELQIQRSGMLPFLGAMEVLIDQGNVQKAFERAEDAKSQLLFEVISRGTFTLSREMTRQERTEERRLAGEVVSLKLQASRIQQSEKVRERLNAARSALQNFRRTLYTKHPRLRVNRGELTPFTFESLRRFIDNKTALLEYAVSDDKVFLFVITSAKSSPVLNVYQLNSGRAQLATLAARLQELIATHNDEAFQTARELYDALIKPAENLIADKSELIIVPDGVLWDVPFEALQKEEQSLIDKASVSYAISVSALKEMRKRTAISRKQVGPTTVLAFGNLKLTECCAVERVRTLYKGMGLEKIFGDSPELNVLQTLYGRSRSRFYTDTEAKKTRVTVEANKFNVLHFGTPTFLDQYQPLQSITMLDDGLLTLSEVTEVNSKAQVVSFFNSAIAQRQAQSGNAFIALSWAWFVAGTPVVLLTRWQADAASVTDIASEFHGGLMQSQRAPHALRQGALKVKRSPGRANLYHWSGFMIIGV